jgi:hypothetical protein
MDFSEALTQLRAGERLQRAGWNGKGLWIAIQRPDAHSKMGHPYLYISDVNGILAPWTASQTDILATDWQPVRKA